MILVSVTTHLSALDISVAYCCRGSGTESPVVNAAGGAHQWQIEGQKDPCLGLNAVAGRPKEEYDSNRCPTNRASGCYEIMRAAIIACECRGWDRICFGSSGLFAGRDFKDEDKELALATIQHPTIAFHDWCVGYRGRFHSAGMLSALVRSLGVADQRMCKLGVVTTSHSPDKIRR